MYIYSYKAQSGRSLPFVCAFYRPYEPKYSEIQQWVKQTYDVNDVHAEIDYGEVHFRHERDAALFVLRWT